MIRLNKYLSNTVIPSYCFILSLVCYGNTLNNQFALDDSLVLIGNEFTKKGFDGIADIWTHDMFVGAHGQEFELTGGRYRPLSLTILAIEYELFYFIAYR